MTDQHRNRSERIARQRTGTPRRRRSLLLAVAALAIAAIAGLALFGRAGSISLGTVPGQNVLLITIDTLRADALHSYGGQASTPALDRLAAAGVRFDFAHAHAVVTLPSHASILTGTYPYQHGIRDNSGYRLPSSTQTVATLLKHAGYATAAFVGAFPLHSRFGLNVGFDVYDDRFGETRAPTDFVMPERPATTVVALARQWLSASTQHPAPGTSTQHPAPGTSTQHSAPSTRHPWFVWLHLFDPHAPYKPPPPFDTQYVRAYDGEVAATDAALAPLLDDVRAMNQPTLVIVTGDHGEALGEHGEETHGLFAYESTLRVPLIIAEIDGSRTSRGEVSTAPARHVDILPTILDAVAIAAPSNLVGRSLLAPADRNGTVPRPSYFEAMAAMLNRGWAPLSGIVVDREKYIDLPIPERYDLANDTAEATNIAGRAPERDRTLAAALRGLAAALPGRRGAEDPEAAARLRSLGYVTGDAPIKAKYTEADDPKTLVSVDQEIHRGVDLYTAKRFAEAIDAYQGVIQKRPDMAIAYRHLAFVQWETGQPRGAVETLQRALKAGAVHAGITTQLATYLAETGNATAAIALLEPASAPDDPDGDLLNSLGIAYARAARTADAERTFQRILAVDPNNSLALTNLGALALERGDLASARADFERAVAADATSSQAQAGLGVVSIKSGQRDAAIAAWKRAVELDPTNYDALYNLGMTLAQSGRLEEARPFLGQFARNAPPAFYAKDIREANALLQAR